MSVIVACDTETTSLRPDRRAWEVGLIVREGSHDVPHHWFVQSEDLDLGNADPFSLSIGRFYERHPDYSGSGAALVRPEAYVLQQVEKLTRGAHLVGAVVNFDADVLGARMRAHGILPSWHYHLCDVENLAVGYLRAHAEMVERRGAGELPGPERALALREVTTPPWKSDDLSAALGVTVSDEDRHTALGDAKFAMRIYDAVMGGSR